MAGHSHWRPAGSLKLRSVRLSRSSSCHETKLRQLTLTILVPSIRRDGLLLLSVHRHLAGMWRRIGGNISRPVGHGLKIVKRFVDSGRYGGRRGSTANQVYLLGPGLVPEVYRHNILREVDGAKCLRLVQLFPRIHLSRALT